MRRFFLIFIFIVASLAGFTAPVAIQKPDQKQLRNDSTKVTLRNFDAEKMKSYTGQSEFRYKETPPDQDSLWAKFWRWFWNWFSGVLEHKTSGTFIKYGIIIILAGLVVFIIIKAMGLDLKVLTGKSKAVEVPYSESLENIHEINFRAEIEKAISTGNYRLAVRLFYLHSLKMMNDSQLINWQPDKTNQTYVGELTDPEKRKQFGELTTQFEYIWYGEFFIDKESFAEVKKDFDAFNRRST